MGETEKRSSWSAGRATTSGSNLELSRQLRTDHGGQVVVNCDR